MRADRNLLWNVGLLLCCIVGALLVPSIIKGQTYEVNPYVTVPEYKSDAARAIDAYERTMNRYMDILDKSLEYANDDVKGLAKSLEAIDKKLSELSKRLERIEKALNIPEDTAQNKTDKQATSIVNKIQ